MRLNPYCMCCQINKQEENIRQFDDEKKKMQYMKEILLRLTALRDEDCAPSISVEFKKFFKEFWDVEDTTDFDAIKKDFNSLMMNLEDKLTRNIRAAKDPLESALIHARIGNYIDFGAIPDANKEQLLTLIEEGSREPLDVTEYTNFQRNMENAEALVYLTDNCGEIVLDKIAVQLLKERYPNVKITVIVRGMPCINDATMEDAEMCGLTEIVPVIGNGSDVGGTWLGHINEETRRLLDEADVIIAKGQGNFETLHECGLNIYYLFLCKCDRFVDLFHAKLLQGMFVNENRID